MDSLRRDDYQRGQIVLITLLVMSVAATVILSTIGRSTVDTAITNQIQESQRAFNAAEAGIENALKPNPSITGTLSYSVGNTSSYSVAKTDFGGTNTTYVLPNMTALGDVATIWSVGHNLDGTINLADYYTGNNFYICWTNSAAVELTVFYQKYGGAYQVVKKAYDPDSNRAKVNNFDTTPSPVKSGNCNGNKFPAALYYVKINTTADLGINNCNTGNCDVPIYLRLRPLYLSTQFGVDANGENLPTQGSRYDSTGKVTSSSTTRKITLLQQYPVPPGIADYVIYSNGGSGNFMH